MQTLRLSLISVTALCLSSAVLAQVPPTKSTTVQVTDTGEERGREVRRHVVERFGSPAQIDAFNHPHQPPTKLKVPKMPKDPSPEDLQAIADAYAYRQEPEAIFAQVFQMVVYRALYQGATVDTKAIIAKGNAKAAATSFLLSLVPGPSHGAVAAAAIVNRAQAEADRAQTARLGSARLRISNALAAQYLSTAELETYQRSDTYAKASELFVAAYRLLDGHPVPAAYVLTLCDPGPADKYDGGPARRLTGFFPDDPMLEPAKWNQSTQPEHWRTVTSDLSVFLHHAAEATKDPAHNEAYLHSLPTAPTGLSGPEEIIRDALGPEGLADYAKASDQDKPTLVAGVKAMRLAFEMLFNLAITDLGSGLNGS